MALDYQAEFKINPFLVNAQSTYAPCNCIEKKGNTNAECRILLNGNVTLESANENFDITLYGRKLGDEICKVSAKPIATLWNFNRY